MIRSSKSSAFAAVNRRWYSRYASAYEVSIGVSARASAVSWSTSSFLRVETQFRIARTGKRFGSRSRSWATSCISRLESASS